MKVCPDYAVFKILGDHETSLVLARLKTPDMVGQFALESKGIGSGFNRLYTDSLGPISISLPPPEEQAAIVRFLDWANARQERTIRAKRRVIALLTEQKQAIVHRAVTGRCEETDPNKLSDLKKSLDDAQVYSPEQVAHFVALFLAGVERDQLDPILDACVAVYSNTLDEDQQVDFKGKAKAFCRTYDFLASITAAGNAG